MSEPPRKIMLVDDDGVCLAVVSKGLKRRGFEIVAYKDPREAVAHLSADNPIAVITDMRMPHMSGLQVVQEVQRAFADVEPAPPVLVVSMEDDERLLEEAFRLGATDYLLKPINEVELAVKLERALRKGSEGAPKQVPLPIPERIGDWTLVDCIGRGGTSSVFTAYGPRSERLFAVKIVWPHLLESTETLLRFRREIDTLSGLSHPGLVGFVESGRDGRNYYYVMDYIPGGTLRRRIRRQGSQSPAETLRVVEELCSPLGYLHEQGLVHRDIKPGNVFFDREDRSILGDFGLTRRLQDRGITLEEEFIGTPLYLAPEVFRTAEFDQTVDFYALGVCALEMLLGRPPLDESDTMRLIGQIMDGAMPAPSELLRHTPQPVIQVIESMVGPAENRPRSAEILAAELREARRAIS